MLVGVTSVRLRLAFNYVIFLIIYAFRIPFRIFLGKGT